MTEKEKAAARRRTLTYLKKAGIALTTREKRDIEVAHLGLNEYRQTGLAIVVYVNTRRVCAKELVLEPGQTCPQHRHPAVKGQPGKEETFRCRWGTCYLYVPGRPARRPKAKPPERRAQYYTVWHEIVLRPGDQYTLKPNTWHWFQGGPVGAVVSEFSTRSTDEHDRFTDPDIVRLPD